MRIRMLETRRGTENGFTINRYERDKEYEMGDSLASAFIAAGFAVKVHPPRDNPKKEKLSIPKHHRHFPRKPPLVVVK